MPRVAAIAAALLAVLQPAAGIFPTSSQPTPTSVPAVCRYLPGDDAWPDQAAWDQLNQTVGGRLIRGVPRAQPCHEPFFDAEKCDQIRKDWLSIPAYEADPVTVMAPYWLNTSCSPFDDPKKACEEGNLAVYAIAVSGAADAVAGVRFARDHNVRLTVKNSGHDFLGRSAGAGSLELWVRGLQELAFVPRYAGPGPDPGSDGDDTGGSHPDRPAVAAQDADDASGSDRPRPRPYNGPAARIGPGIIFEDLYREAGENGYRVVGGSCPTVAFGGGFLQGGGHGPLGGTYGMAADQVLEWEVVTAAGKHLIATPERHSDLYWALSGGGGGNYAVVLSATVRVHADAPVAGAAFNFTVPDRKGGDKDFWAAVAAWLRHLPGVQAAAGRRIATQWVVGASFFKLDYATLPLDDDGSGSGNGTAVNRTTAALDAALAPFLADLAALNISLSAPGYVSRVSDGFSQHYHNFVTWEYPSNLTACGRLIPREMVKDETSLAALVSTMRDIANSGSPEMIGVAADFRAGDRRLRPRYANAVLPAWRDALFTLGVAGQVARDARWAELRASQARMNRWQDALRALPRSASADDDGVVGAYLNEATWDNPHWKEEYFGANYADLLAVKRRYDPDYLFWANAAVGSDEGWKAAPDGRLCRV